jgi:signal transduction histidine kinase
MVKFLSWSFFLLLLGFNIVVSMFIANKTRTTLLEKQREYALLLAENLNHQIFQRFTMPTLIGFGRIELNNEAQFTHLDNVIKTTIHSFNVLEVRIYDFEQSISYSTDKDLVGRTDLAGRTVKQALQESYTGFEIISRKPVIHHFFNYKMEPGSVVLKTVHSLHAERRMSPQQRRGPIMGVLEFTQDITDDYRNVINLQRLIIAFTFFSTMVLFFIMLTIIRRANHLTAERARDKERLERELHLSEKMASMGRVVSSIAHEIRNPLGIIRSSSELLLRKARQEKNSNSRILQAIYDESLRLSRTVNDFLDYAKPVKPRTDKVDLAVLVDEVMRFLEPQCEAQECSLTKTVRGRPLVSGDPDLLYRAFYNLMANSLEALRSSDKDAQVRVDLHENNGSVEVVISDTGPGFSEANLDKIADPFFTTKDSGTGLGLAIVENILAGHGAEMSFANTVDGGAMVLLVFPRITPEKKDQ